MDERERGRNVMKAAERGQDFSRQEMMQRIIGNLNSLQLSQLAGVEEATRYAEQGLGGLSLSPLDQAYSADITLANAEDVMTYQPWDKAQQACGDTVREALLLALRAVLRNVPRSPRRTLAIQHIVSARMDANAAISFGGRF